MRVAALLLLLAFCANAQQVLLPNRRLSFQPVASGGAAPTYLVKQDFEGTGYDNSETWSETGTVDEDYATAPAPLVGSQSARATGTTQRLTSPTFTGQDEVYWYFQVNLTTVPAGTLTFSAIIGPGVSIDRLGGAGGVLRIGGTVNSPATSDAMATGTTYHFLVRYRKDLDGGGGSAIYSVEFNTTGTFDGAGNDFTQATTGTDTAQATAVRFSWEGSTTTDYVVDKVRVDDVAIGSSPP